LAHIDQIKVVQKKCTKKVYRIDKNLRVFLCAVDELFLLIARPYSQKL
jgi:hypothetical protein